MQIRRILSILPLLMVCHIIPVTAETLVDGGAVLELLILGSKCERELRTSLKLLRMALFALSAVLVYIYGYEYLPLSAALLLLCLHEK